MCHLTLNYNLDTHDVILTAVKTILDTYIALKKKLDVTMEEKNSLNQSLQMLQQTLNIAKETNESITSPRDDDYHHRKRKKTATPPDMNSTNMASSQDLTNDDLNNAALYISTCDEDDIIAATPLPPDTSLTHNLSLGKSRSHKRSPTTSTNKENKTEIKKSPIKVSDSPLKQISDNANKICKKVELSATAETPDTLFSSPPWKGEWKVRDKNVNTTVTPVNRSYSKIRDVKGEASSWRSKADLIAKSTPKKLFPDWSCSAVKQPEIPEADETKRAITKRSNLSLSRSTKLKQPTISFPKINQNEETYCEGINSSVDDNPFSKSSPTSAIRIKLEPLEDSARKPLGRQFPIDKQRTSTTPVKADILTQTSSESVFAVPKETDEIIILDESQSSEDFLKNVFLKDETNEPTAVKEPPIESKKITRSLTLQPRSERKLECADCEQYYKALGQNLDEKELRKRMERCSKHKKIAPRPDTPPGFWNPKFPDTPEGEHIETPIDYRFTRNRI